MEAMPDILLVSQVMNPHGTPIKVRALAESDLPNGNYAQWSMAPGLAITVHMDPSSPITCESLCNMVQARAEEQLTSMREKDLTIPHKRYHHHNLSSWTCHCTDVKFRGGPADKNSPLNTDGHEYDMVLHVEGKYERKAVTQACGCWVS